MKKVLALVLALTMVLGFAATASASYGWNYIKRDLFNVDPSFTVGGLGYTTDMSVDGNKEYTIKTTFDATTLNSYTTVIDDVYDNLDQEYRILEVIQDYTKGDFAVSEDWVAKVSAGGETDNITDGANPLYAAVNAIVSPATDSSIYSELISAVTAATTANKTHPFREGYRSSSFSSAINELNRAWDAIYGANSYYGYEDGIAVTATSKDETYATVTSQPTVEFSRKNGKTECTVEFKVKFTNTTFRTADVDVEVLFQSGGVNQVNRYEDKYPLSFTVYQAQYRTFTAQDASIAFGVTPNVQISADEYAYISADAFRLMLQNSNRSITVVSGMGDSKVRFDSDSTNLPQDVFVGNFATKNTGTTAASISGFSSTTAAKIKIAVGKAFYDANVNKTISVFDANGNKLDVEATLQGDYTVNFFAPLSNYTVSSSDWAGQNTNTNTDSGKTNPSMGGAL